MKATLADAHDKLRVPQGASLEVIKTAYKRLAIAHHPYAFPPLPQVPQHTLTSSIRGPSDGIRRDKFRLPTQILRERVFSLTRDFAPCGQNTRNGNSPESNAKFQEISAAYQRILNHFDRPEPRAGEGRGQGGVPFGFPFEAGWGFYSSGGARGFPSWGGYDFDDDDDDDDDGFRDDGNWSDVSADSDDPAQEARDYWFWMFEEILRGGFGTQSSRQEYQAHSQQHEETKQERAERLRAEAERIVRAQRERKEAEAAAKQKQLEEAARRRQQKRAAATASKTAADLEAVGLARRRLALLQTRRSQVFAAARQGDVQAVKHGVYELNVDPSGGEWIPGGPEAVAESEAAGTEVTEEKVLSKSQRKKAKAKAKASATASPSADSPAAMSPSPEIPSNFAPPSVDPAPAANASAQNADVETQGAEPVGATPPTRSEVDESINSVETDPRETLLHIAVARNQQSLYEWLLDHGSVPEERNSNGFTAFHLALLLNHAPLVEHAFADLEPPFPPTPYREALEDPDPYYPLPKNQTLLSLALIGGGKDPMKVLELVRLVLPFVGGREVAKGWKKAEFEQGRKHIKLWKWDTWEEIKWILAERMQALDFEGFTPPEEYQGRRPRVY
ncbi:hypothetical protein JCM11491_002143 [Sporobolomyces phaffii]